LRSILLALALVAAVVSYAWLLPESGFPTWLRLRDEVAQAEQRIRLLERQNHALREEVAALARESFAQERAVREELGWVRPGEILVRAPRQAGLVGEDAAGFAEREAAERSSVP
jgi:cell division protein FtsB